MRAPSLKAFGKLLASHFPAGEKRYLAFLDAKIIFKKSCRVTSL
jgi:hypothetical protein